MSAFDALKLSAVFVTLVLGARALWKTRGNQSALAGRVRRQVTGIFMAVSILPAEMYLKDLLPLGAWVVLVFLVGGVAFLLILRS